MLNNNISQHFKGYELFIKQLLEGIQRYQRNNICIPFGFVGIDKFEIIKSVLNDEVPYTILKVNENALSGRLVIGTNIIKEEYIACLHGYLNHKFGSINHRDILGALNNLGISIETYGEIWKDEDDFYLVCSKEISNFILNNLTKVSRFTIQLELLDYFPTYDFHYDRKEIIVSGYRIDTIVSEIIHTSRNKTQEYIKENKCNLNFKEVNDCSLILKENDILSLRGYGRYKIGKKVNNTKSGNIIIEIMHFI